MDVDIDVPPGFRPEQIFKSWTRASLVKDGKLVAHPCGVYPQLMPIDPVTRLAAIPYEEAEKLGYWKVDFLHLQLYKYFKSRTELEELLKKEPDWALLQVPSVQEKVFQLSKHGDLLSDLKPKSILELADVMALIRPGKKQFIGLYKKDREAARRLLYAKDETSYSFKKAHALAYSYVVLLQLHFIEQGRL